MEKFKPSCPLERVHSLIKDGKFRITFTALLAASELGFDGKRAIAEEVLTLKATEFYKSMTTYRNSRVWQDVYRHQSKVGMLYIKLTITADVLVVSFKEL